MIKNLLKRITRLLEDNDFTYMVSGSHALNWYVNPRTTMDIDIVIELNLSNVEQFINLFQEGFYINIDSIKKETKSQGIFNIIDLKSGFRIDFIVKKDTNYRTTEFTRKKRVRYDDFELWIVAPEDLIISKISWIQDFQSDKQMDDIKILLTLQNIDINYIANWCKKLKLNTYNLV